MAFNYDEFKARWRARAAQLGIDTEAGATGFQVATMKAERIKRERYDAAGDYVLTPLGKRRGADASPAWWCDPYLWFAGVDEGIYIAAQAIAPEGVGYAELKQMGVWTLLRPAERTVFKLVQSEAYHSIAWQIKRRAYLASLRQEWQGGKVRAIRPLRDTLMERGLRLRHWVQSDSSVVMRVIDTRTGMVVDDAA